MAKKKGKAISGQTVTPQRPLTVASPASATTYGQVVSEINPTFGVGSKYGRGGSKTKSKQKRTRYY